MNSTTYTAREWFDTATVGDMIRVPHYENALRVNYVSPPDGAGLVGVEFVDDALAARGASKSLVQNRNSGRVYLVAGTADKGEVREVEVLAETAEVTA